MKLNDRDLAKTQHWRFLSIVVGLGLLFRIAVAISTDSVSYPDEIFQYLEQAHRLVFHYGLVPWEYRFGIRSWAIPGFIGAILLWCKSVGLDAPAQYAMVVKIVFCCLSATLIVSCYYITRALANETAARFAAVLVAGWWELVYFAHKPTPEVLSTYTFFGAVCLTLGEKRWTRALLIGFLVGITFGLRIQIGALLVAVAAWMLLRWPPRMYFASAAAFLVTMLGFGWLDLLTWSGWFASFEENLLFNGEHHISSLFGTNPIWYYAYTMIVFSGGIVAIGGIGLLLEWRRTWPLIFGAILLFAVHTIVPHKEYRFIFSLGPIWLIGTAICAASLLKANVILGRSIIAACALVSVAGLADRIPREDNILWGRAPIMRSNMLAAFYSLDATPDLVSVYDGIDTPFHSPGYFALHRDVPLYFNFNFEDGENPAKYAQFWIRGADVHPPAARYTLWKTFGKIRVWRDSGPVKSLPGYTRGICEPGIDDKYVPSVTPTIPAPSVKCART